MARFQQRQRTAQHRRDAGQRGAGLRFRLGAGREIELPLLISWDLPLTAFGHRPGGPAPYTDHFGAVATTPWRFATRP